MEDNNNNDFLSQEIPFDKLEEYKESHLSDKFKTVGDVLKSYQELEKKIGQKRTNIPGNNATEEDWNNFYADLRAKDATEYTEDFDELMGEDMKATLSDTFYKNGISKRQSKAIAGEINKVLNRRFQDEYGQESLNKALEEFGDRKAIIGAKIDEIFGEDYIKSDQNVNNREIASVFKVADALMKEYGVKEQVKQGGKPATPSERMSQDEMDVAFFKECKKARDDGTMTREKLASLQKKYNQ